MPKPAPTDIDAEVKAIYAELDQRPLERSCTALTTCCRFKLTGETPYLTKGEAVVAARAWKAAGGGRLPEAGKDGSCPMLEQKTGRCRIYEARPFGCRTHFCRAAGGPYPRREVRDLIHRLEDLSRALGQDEAMPLRPAIEAALRDASPRGAPSQPYRRY
jgi:Fe-S-cluster containining protein